MRLLHFLICGHADARAYESRDSGPWRGRGTYQLADLCRRGFCWISRCLNAAGKDVVVLLVARLQQVQLLVLLGGAGLLREHALELGKRRVHVACHFSGWFFLSFFRKKQHSFPMASHADLLAALSAATHVRAEGRMPAVNAYIIICERVLAALRRKKALRMEHDTYDCKRLQLLIANRLRPECKLSWIPTAVMQKILEDASPSPIGSMFNVQISLDTVLDDLMSTIDFRGDCVTEHTEIDSSIAEEFSEFGIKRKYKNPRMLVKPVMLHTWLSLAKHRGYTSARLALHSIKDSSAASFEKDPIGFEGICDDLFHMHFSLTDQTRYDTDILYLVLNGPTPMRMCDPTASIWIWKDGRELIVRDPYLALPIGMCEKRRD